MQPEAGRCHPGLQAPACLPNRAGGAGPGRAELPRRLSAGGDSARPGSAVPRIRRPMHGPAFCPSSPTCPPPWRRTASGFVLHAGRKAGAGTPNPSRREPRGPPRSGSPGISEGWFLSHLPTVLGCRGAGPAGGRPCFSCVPMLHCSTGGIHMLHYAAGIRESPRLEKTFEIIVPSHQPMK